MYEITVEKVFSAAHAIRLPDGSLEPVHGHNWNFSVTVASDKLDAMETVMDFHVLEKKLDELVAHVHNKHLNDVTPFTEEGAYLKINTTAERVAWWIGTETQTVLPEGVTLVGVSVGEAPGCTATWRP